MSQGRDSERWLDGRFWWLNAAVWSVLALTNAGAVAADMARAGQPVDWPRLLAYYGAVFASWFVMTPLVFAYVARFPPADAGWRRLALRYLPLVPPWLLFYAPAISAITSLAQHGTLAQTWQTLDATPINQWVLDSVYLVAVVGIAAASYQVREGRERERLASRLALENSSLETRLSEARLEMLRAQLEPHFLYNALNSIAALVRQGDGETAVEAVGLLSELLRYATRATDRPHVLLAEEIDFAEAYWGFQGLRYGDRLRCEFDIDQAAVDCRVPPLILQPLLENAVRHGVETLEAASRVALVARREGEEIALEVRNRPGVRGGADGGTGVGLRNVRERLQWLYGRPFELAVGLKDDEFIARLRLPTSLPAPAQTTSSPRPEAAP